MKRWIEDTCLVLVLSALFGFAAGAMGAVPVPLWQRCMITAPWTIVWLHARWDGER